MRATHATDPVCIKNALGQPFAANTVRETGKGDFRSYFEPVAMDGFVGTVAMPLLIARSDHAVSLQKRETVSGYME
ncbi:hypothetical protein B0G81_3432 [Paraburkholderia sp. BL6665CI2N2]|nr:hypothetical protein B0G81_3432 [Paraburkholderia sp. BL6665CI2N2]